MWEELGPIREAAAGLAQWAAWSLADEQAGSCLDRVHRAGQARAAARLHLVAEIGGRDLPARQGVASSVSWLAGRLHISLHTARQWVEVAGYVHRRPGLDAALTAGTVNVDQAKVIGA